MAICDHCGNEYDKVLEINYQGETKTFDSFECAIHVFAPRCAHCGVTVIGHGREKGGAIYCCDHCASHAG